MGARRAHVRDGGRLPAVLRRPAHPDLREDRVRQGTHTFLHEAVFSLSHFFLSRTINLKRWFLIKLII